MPRSAPANSNGAPPPYGGDAIYIPKRDRTKYRNVKKMNVNAIVIPMQSATKKSTVEGLLPMKFDEEDDEKFDEVLEFVSCAELDVVDV